MFLDPSFHVVNKTLNQPAALKYCSEYFNGTLHDLQSNISRINGLLQDGKQYWTGVVFNYEIKQYYKLGATFSGTVRDKNNQGNLCVTAQKTGQNFIFSSSKCCGETAHHFICSTRKIKKAPGIV